MNTSYYLRLQATPTMPQFHALQEKDGAYLSANGRQVAWANAARFTTEAAAILFRELWLARLQDRYGDQVSVFVETMAAHGGRGEKLLGDDAAVLLARGRTKRLVRSRCAGSMEIRYMVEQGEGYGSGEGRCAELRHSCGPRKAGWTQVAGADGAVTLGCARHGRP